MPAYQPTMSPAFPPLSKLITRALPITPSYDTCRQAYAIDFDKIDSINFPNDYARASYYKLPVNTLIWSWFEQKNNPKIFDPDYFIEMDDHKLADQYLPESRNVLELAAYRVPASFLDKAILIDNEFTNRFRDGDGYYTLLVHPSLRNDALFLSAGCALSARRFYFMPAASPRTGLTWELGRESQPFIAKMSYRPKVAVKTKGDLAGEGESIIAVAKSAIVAQSVVRSSIFTDDYSLQLHQPSEISKQAYNGFGVLFRSIPQDVLNGSALYIPYFSLAAGPTNGVKPLLATLIENSGLSVAEYLQQHIYPAVIKLLLNTFDQGIYPVHLHGQNLLVKLAVKPDFDLGKVKIFKILPEVMYRDISDLKIAAEIESKELASIRKQQNAPDPACTPGAYLYLASTDFIKRSIYPMLIALQSWQNTGLLARSAPIDHQTMILPFFQKLLNSLESMAGRQGKEYSDYIHNTIYEFTCFNSAEVQLVQGSRRERDWLNSTLSLFKHSLTYVMPADSSLDEFRYKRLQQHLEDFREESLGKYQELDGAPQRVRLSTPR